MKPVHRVELEQSEQGQEAEVGMWREQSKTQQPLQAMVRQSHGEVP